jgi:hypothetical protein
MTDGYASIQRKWKKGDNIKVSFDMQPRVVKANENVEADRGRVAVERGPLVYCAEWPDNDFKIRNVVMSSKPVFEVQSKPETLYGINVIKTNAQTLNVNPDGKISVKDVTLTLIPYYAWAHRGQGAMAVWLQSATKF